ncbi:MAG TPA: chromosome partitioning protein ParB, partial [Nitrospiraceae bacterium]|nr:chromosome partitioning protein ParB [Nitrospiraceae bacterium]
MNVVQIPVKQVFPDPKQPRKTFKAETLRELGETIKKRGQRQPINVEPADGGYMIVEGERRWRACILAGIPTVDAIVRERSNHNGRENLLSQIIENVQREDMNPVDEALAYRELQTKHGMVVNEIAHEVGKNSSRVYKLLKILDLPVKVQELIRDDRLSHDERLVDALLSITDRKAQTGLAERAA